MELSVASHSSIPEGSILSICSGSICQQTRVSCGVPLRFPAIPTSMKVEVWQPVATGHLIMRPGSAIKDKSHNVVFHDNANIKCQINLVPLSEDAIALSPTPTSGRQIMLQPLSENEKPTSPIATGFSPKPPPRPVPTSRRPKAVESKLSSTSSDAESYKNKHGLLECVERVLEIILRDRPEDPYSAMAALFGSQAHKIETEPIHEEQETQPKEVQEAWPSSSMGEEQLSPSKGESVVRKSVFKQDDGHDATCKSIPMIVSVSEGLELEFSTSDSEPELAASHFETDANRDLRWPQVESTLNSAAHKIQTDHHNRTPPCEEEPAAHKGSALEHGDHCFPGSPDRVTEAWLGALRRDLCDSALEFINSRQSLARMMND